LGSKDEVDCGGVPLLFLLLRVFRNQLGPQLFHDISFAALRPHKVDFVQLLFIVQ
jgi:hypothetical protein